MTSSKLNESVRLNQLLSNLLPSDNQCIAKDSKSQLRLSTLGEVFPFFRRRKDFVVVQVQLNQNLVEDGVKPGMECGKILIVQNLFILNY